jgi:signal transduction histidine kinase
LQIKSGIFHITKTVKRNAIGLTLILLAVYLVFNFFNVLELNYLLEENLDDRLMHELEHIQFAVTQDRDSLYFRNPNEFKESDLVDVTDSPFFLQIYDFNGEIVFTSENIKKTETIPVELVSFEDEFFFKDIEIKYSSLRVGYAWFYDMHENRAGIIQLSTPKAANHQITENIIFFNLTMLPAVFIIFALISLVLAKKSFSPVNKIVELANEISASKLDQRLFYEADPDDELGKLKTTLNNLFERLESQVDQISQFSDNASHQLMTPLTSVKTEIDYLMKNSLGETERRESLEVLKTQTDRLINIVRTMLLLSKDCEECHDEKSVFDLKNLFDEEILSHYMKGNVSFNIDAGIYIRGKAEYFSQAIQNVINNAIKYSEEKSEVVVRTVLENKQVIISVEDKGRGISDDDREKIFTRFYRGYWAEDSGIKGYGLGLSLVKSVVERMSGTIKIEDNDPKGTIFKIILPVLELE